MADIFPFDDPNVGLDEQWARFYPYTAVIPRNHAAELKVIIRNHSARNQQFRVTPHVPPGWKTSGNELQIEVEGHGEGAVTIPLTAPAAGAGLSLVTADVAFGTWEFKRWIEAMITVSAE
jgi:hypothetical protein